HRSQGMQEAPDARTEEGHDGATQGPGDGGLVRVFPATLPEHAEGEQHHQEERQRFDGGEDRADPQPVVRRTHEEVVVTGTQDPGDQRHGDDQIQPLLDHFTVHARGLDQDEGQDRTKDQLPHAFHPQMHYPPPEVLVHDQRHRVVEGEHPEHAQTDQAGDEYHVDHGLAASEDGHQDVEDEAHHHQRYADLGDRRLLEELATHGREVLVAGDFRQGGVGHQQVAEDRQYPGHGEDPAQPVAQLRAPELGLGFLGHQVVGRAHEGEQQPDDQQVGVHHTSHVEGDFRKQEVADDVLGAEYQPEDDLANEQEHGNSEVGLCHRL